MSNRLTIPAHRQIKQRIVDEARGDCFSCCIATLLGLPYDDVPKWVADAYDRKKPHEAWDDILEWLRLQNYHLVTFQWDDLNDWRGLGTSLCIASMKSQRFKHGRHAVIGSWFLRRDGGHQFYVVFDPSTKNKKYPVKAEPSQVQFLVPIDPAMTRVQIERVRATNETLKNDGKRRA